MPGPRNAARLGPRPILGGKHVLTERVEGTHHHSVGRTEKRERLPTARAEDKGDLIIVLTQLNVLIKDTEHEIRN